MRYFKSVFFALTLALVMPLSLHADLLIRGTAIPDLSTSPLVESEGYAKLGLSQTSGPVKLSDIKGDLLVLELFNRFCMSCLKQTAEVEKFHQSLSEMGLADKVKVLGIGIGNGAADLLSYKKVTPYTFAVAPDQMFNFYYDIGDLDSAPTTLFLKRKGDKWILADGHGGIHGATEMLVRTRVLLANREGEMPPIDFSGKKNGSLLSEAEKEQYAKTALARVGIDGALLKKVDAPKMDIWQAMNKDNNPNGLYAVVAKRLPVCDLCHESIFALVIDAAGTVKAFLPIYLTKFGNEAWSDEDNTFLDGRIKNRSGDALTFDTQVDAVTSATISSSLIFDEARRASAIISKLGIK